MPEQRHQEDDRDTVVCSDSDGGEVSTLLMGGEDRGRSYAHAKFQTMVLLPQQIIGHPYHQLEWHGNHHQNVFLQLLQQEQHRQHLHLASQLLERQQQHEQQRLRHLRRQRLHLLPEPQRQQLHLMQLPQQYLPYLLQQPQGQQLVQPQTEMPHGFAFVGVGLRTFVFAVMICFGFA